MRRHIPTLLAVVAIATLAALTFQFAGSTDAGSADRARTVTNAGVPPAVPDIPLAGCSLEATEGVITDVALTVAGACGGTIPDALHCVAGDEAFNGSLSHPVDGGRDFFLTVILPEFNGAGEYDDAKLFAQVADPGGTSRWSNRAASVIVDDEDAVQIESTVLDAEPGTGTLGALTLSGDVSCAPSVE